jgi:hypothetical protein
MQNNSVAQKARIIYEGEEVPGLVSIGEIPEEDDAISVPGFQIIRSIRTGVRKMPEIELKYEARRNTNTRSFLSDWYRKKTAKDVTVIYCDADGVEFARYLWSQVECRKHVLPETNHEKIDYSNIKVTVMPYDITEVV